jgi:hypothetical protein
MFNMTIRCNDDRGLFAAAVGPWLSTHRVAMHLDAGFQLAQRARSGS